MILRLPTINICVALLSTSTEMSKLDKRLRVAPDIEKPRKKRKVQSRNDTSTKARQLGALVNGDDLRWQEVTLPERLEDAEGFLGLEEIEDVDVIKEERTSQVKFRSTKTAPTTETEGEEEWTGFDDTFDTLPTKEWESALTKDLPVANSHAGRKTSKWATLGLSKTLDAIPFAEPTPIQASAIPHILGEKRDLIGKAVTGSGKTLAFGLPIIESWLSQPSPSSQADFSPFALILSPTRELARQLSAHLTAVNCSPKPRVTTITGGLSTHKQLRELKTANIVVATPGRLWQLISEESSSILSGLKQVKFLVIDEADRLLQQGHFEELEKALDALDRRIISEPSEASPTPPLPSRQTLLFSATFTNLDRLLPKLNFHDPNKPLYIDASPSTATPATLHESLLECGALEKDLYLYHLLLTHPKSKTLIFTNSIATVKRLHALLTELHLPASALHSSTIQRARYRALERFTGGSGGILVATDVAARGLDIDCVDLIVHYHVPRTREMYVHRSGRTARAQKGGRSILLCSPQEYKGVLKIVGVGLGEGLKREEVDRVMVGRLVGRVKLAQRIVLWVGEKVGRKDERMRAFAEELGVEGESEEGEGENKGGRASNEEIKGLRAQLGVLLKQRIT